MTERQLNTAFQLLEGTYENGWLTQWEYWEIEGAIIDIFMGDGTEFLNSLKEYPRKKAVQILYTIGWRL